MTSPSPAFHQITPATTANEAPFIEAAYKLLAPVYEWFTKALTLPISRRPKHCWRHWPDSGDLLDFSSRVSMQLGTVKEEIVACHTTCTLPYKMTTKSPSSPWMPIPDG
jgi:hypothetical protein